MTIRMVLDQRTAQPILQVVLESAELCKALAENMVMYYPAVAGCIQAY